ncbi:MAG: BrxA family protein [Eisenbergiella massiliensis]
MTNSKYSAGLMSQSFWFLEFKKVVRLRQEGLAYEDIKKEVCHGKSFWSSQRISCFKNDRVYYYPCESDG